VKSILGNLEVQNLETFNFDFYEFLHFVKDENYQINQFKAPKSLKTSKLVSRKM